MKRLLSGSVLALVLCAAVVAQQAVEPARDEVDAHRLTPAKAVRMVGARGWDHVVVVVEAMKMQNEIKSPKAGTVQKIVAAEGATVNAGEVLAVVD